MPNCVVKGCSSNSTNPDYDESGRKVTLHQFPTKVTRAEWIQILRDRGGRSATWEPNANAKICSMHFDESDIDRTGQCVRIKAHAVPLYFNSLKRKSRKRPSEEQPDGPSPPSRPQPSPQQPLANSSPPSLIPIKTNCVESQVKVEVCSPPPPLPPIQVIVKPPPTSMGSSAPQSPPAATAPLPSPEHQHNQIFKILVESALPMVSKEESIAPPLAPVVAGPRQAPARPVQTLTTKATLQSISSPILGSIMRGTPLSKREQMLNSPAVTSTLVEKCIRRSKKFQELVSGEKDPSILRGIISKTLKDVNFYEALKSNLNCEKERQMNEERERELRADMIMQEMKALTSTTKYALQEAQDNFENFFKMDIDMARTKVKILRNDLQRNYMVLNDKWERMAQIIEGESRKYEPVSVITPCPAAPPLQPVGSSAEMYLASTNGPVNANAPGIAPMAVEKLQQMSRSQVVLQQTADTVETAAAVASILQQDPQQMAAAQEPPRDFNPKTYLPKKHKAMLKLAEEQAHKTTPGMEFYEEDEDTVRKKIKIDIEGACLAE